MKVDIKVNIGRGGDPAPTIAHYTRARWERDRIILTGTASCQGKWWNVRHTYYIPDDLLWRLRRGLITKEEVLKLKFTPPFKDEEKDR